MMNKYLKKFISDGYWIYVIIGIIGLISLYLLDL
jgi:hypothetical protein